MDYYTRKVLNAAKLIFALDFATLIKRIRKRLRWLRPPHLSIRWSRERFLGVKEEFLLRAGMNFDNFLLSDGHLDIQSSPNPDLTIVLVLFNKAELTYLCLRTLSQLSRSALSFDVIVIDNQSSDRTDQLLGRLSGVRVVKNAKNIGFLQACNQALDMVTSEYLLLLNNDTEVHPGSIESALKTFKETPNCGAVGARIILPSGKLQEAGNILWNDGTCVGYARGLPPYAPEAMFRREVDYCSGAFLLTKTAFFRETNGFDLRYLPAYYEETDFCVEMQKRNRKIIYEPRAVISHFEFGSSTINSKTMELMGRNCQKFREKHADFLSSKPAPGTDQLIARATARQKRVLILDDYVPHKYLGAGFPRTNDLVRTLVSLGYAVTIFPTIYPYEAWSTAYSDIDPGVEIYLNAGLEGLGKFLCERLRYYDLVWVCRPHNMEHLVHNCHNFLVNCGVPVIYDAEAIFSARVKLEQEVHKGSMSEALKLEEQEFSLASSASAIVSVCDYEAKLWRQRTKRPVHVLGHPFEIADESPGFGEREGFVFVGSLHGVDSPNADSLFWFADEVLPRIEVKLGKGQVLNVLGFNSIEKHERFDRYRSSLNFIGRVDDLRPHLNRFRLMVIPTRYAAGIPQKAFDAAKHGIPTVCTDLIAAQMGWTNGMHTLCADWKKPERFADNCVRLYSDQELWNKLRGHMTDYMRQGQAASPFDKSVGVILEQTLENHRL